MLGWIPTIDEKDSIRLVYFSFLLQLWLNWESIRILMRIISFVHLSFVRLCLVLDCVQKIFNSMLIQPKNVFLDHVHDGLGLPQGLFIILVLVLLRCLGDQVYGLLKCVARHGRHSAYQLPAL